MRYGVKRFCQYTGIALLLVGSLAAQYGAALEENPIAVALQSSVQKYVDILSEAAEQNPTKNTFRRIMKPYVTDLPGVRAATLLDPDFKIRQVYFRRHFAGIGYDVKSQDVMKSFFTMMTQKPEPQISGPTLPKLLRPSFVALRHPIMRDNSLTGVLTMFIATDTLLAQAGLLDGTAYRITSPDVGVVSKGTLSEHCQKTVIPLPSTQWTIEYDSTNTYKTPNREESSHE